MKKKLSKEVKIGIAFLISIFVLYFGISFLKGINIFRPANSYIVVFDDVTDLALSSPVILNGLQVGLVHSMKLDPGNPQQVIAIVNLYKGVKIPKGSSFELDIPTLGGGKVLLKPNYGEETYYTSSDTIRGIRNHGMLESLSGGMLPQITGVLTRIDSVLIGFQTVASNPALTQSLINTEQITKQLSESTRQLSGIMTRLNKDVPAITSNIATISDDVKGLTSQTKSINLATTYNSVDSIVKNIHHLTEKINTKDNSLGLLLNDRQLYDSINTTLNNASLLLKDVKENPGRYINVKVF